VDALQSAITEFYGTDPKLASDYGRIVNERHCSRLMKLFETFDQNRDDCEPSSYGGHVVFGGGVDACDLSSRYIPPTIVADVGVQAHIMEDEIFGPILPIVPIDVEPHTGSDMDPFIKEAVTFINQKDHPLALYIFSTNDEVTNWVLDNTQSGGVTVNDTIMHISTPGLPFGGVGPSGMGAYHGKYGFDTFTHRRAVLKRSLGLEKVNDLRYPPYTDKQMKWVSWLLSN
jgi:aldehyde dehydrogenase (NAD+)